MTIQWKIKDLERETDTGGVIRVHWCASKNGVSSQGRLVLTPDPSAADFIPFDSLTEEQVLEWVHANLDKDAIESGVVSEFAGGNDGSVASGAPWISENVPETIFEG